MKDKWSSIYYFFTAGCNHFQTLCKELPKGIDVSAFSFKFNFVKPTAFEKIPKGIFAIELCSILIDCKSFLNDMRSRNALTIMNGQAYFPYAAKVTVA